MKVKKILPVALLVVMAIATVTMRQCKQETRVAGSPKIQTPDSGRVATSTSPAVNGLDRTTKNLFFTKHAKCRMKCRHITQQEVKDILVRGTVNYNKSELKDPKGATYAVEGVTRDTQKVRIIFAPKQQHLTAVTVIDLEVDYQCNCS